MPDAGLLLSAKAGLRRLATAWRVWRSASILRAGRGLHIGAGCRFWAPVGIEIGQQCYIGREVVIETNAVIGDFALIASRVAFVGRRDHETTRLGVPMRFGRWVAGHDVDPHVRQAGVVVEDDVWIGFGAVVLSGVRVGRGAIVAAGAVVHCDVEPYLVVAGNPAREVSRRFTDLTQRVTHEQLIREGRFEFAERGYEFWRVEPGEPRP